MRLTYETQNAVLPCENLQPHVHDRGLRVHDEVLEFRKYQDQQSRKSDNITKYFYDEHHTEPD